MVEITLGHILGEEIGAPVMNVPAVYPPDVPEPHDTIPTPPPEEDEMLATWTRRLYAKGYQEGYAVGHAVGTGLIELPPAPFDGTADIEEHGS